MKQLVINLDKSWVLSHRTANRLPGEIVAEVLKIFGIAVVSESFSEIRASMPTDNAELEELQGKIVEALAACYEENADDVRAALEFRADEVTEEKPAEEKQQPAPEVKPAPKPQSKPEQKSAEPQESAMDAIGRLLGSEEFTALCRKINELAPLLKKNGLEHILTARCYLFSVDDGGGLSTALELLTKLITELGLFELKGYPVEMKLEASDGRNDPLKQMGDDLAGAKGKLVCIDIRNWMDKASAPEFRDFLTRLHRRNDQLIYVFRVPYLEKGVLKHIESAISDVMLLDTVSFVPLNRQQLQEVAAGILTGYGFTATAESWDLFQQRLAEERSDGRFYGTKTVRKVVDEMIFLKFQSILETGEENTVIEAADLRGFVFADDQISAAERMRRLIGVDAIRARIEEIVSQIEFARKNKGVQSPAMHMRFVGNPGTGKTTVARIVGQLLKERGILSKGYFFEHNGGDFLGMYVGHTAPKTLALCRDAYGSVLFIDEAYTLADANYSSGGGYAKEAIDTLIAQMENHRDDMVVIMAGYPKEMDRLMALNPGLAGRMPYELVFPNYSRQELSDICMQMIESNGFVCGEGVEAAIRSYFENLEDSFLNSSDFANARFVRNLFERTWSKTVSRAQLDGSDPKCILLEDFNGACGEDARTLGEKKKKQTRPGYRLGLV